MNFLGLAARNECSKIAPKGPFEKFWQAFRYAAGSTNRNYDVIFKIVIRDCMSKVWVKNENLF